MIRFAKNKLSARIFNDKFAISKFYSTVKSSCLIIEKYGEPQEVIQQHTNILNFDNHSNDIHIKYIASVIHPADINLIQGVYAIKPALPTVIGNEGVAKVISVGSKVESLHAGDLVIPLPNMSGTLCTDAIINENNVWKIDSRLLPTTAAVIHCNPGTAYRLLHDFVKLKLGDRIIQTGATSAVGIYVIQLAREMGIETINVIRSRSSEAATERTKEMLHSYGANIVLTEEELRTKSSRDISVPLALNCVGGRPAISLIKSLDHAGVLVSYGAMNKQPLTIGVGPLIFKDISLRGFWFSRWRDKVSKSTEWSDMMHYITEMFISGRLKPSPFHETKFSDWKHAIDSVTFSDKTPEDITYKQLLIMSE